MRNMNYWDRLIRSILGAVFLIGAIFWLGGALRYAALGGAIVLWATSAVGFCPVYRVLGLSLNPPSGAVSARGKWMAGFLVLSILALGSFGSAVLTRKIFLEDFNGMNHFYKQTLFLTGKNEREKAIEQYDQLIPAYQKFERKYLMNRPYALWFDPVFDGDLQRVRTMLGDVETLVRSGDLHQAHLDLEKVRPVFQEIFKRNKFSMLSVALVDFHDAMELILEAGLSQDAAKVQQIYPQVNEKLLAVEAEANDAEIQAIRQNLDELLALSKQEARPNMSSQAEKLKSSFVKVYLKRG